MPQWDGTLPGWIDLDAVAARLRTTLSTTSVATALFPLLSPSGMTVSGRLAARPSAPEPPLPLEPPPVQVPTPVPLSTRRVILFDEDDDA